MRERLAELIATLEEGRACVYCAVIETRGSTPQKAGAIMLVFAGGSQSGTLGGGCVEAEVKCRALHRLNAGGGAEVFTFHLDDDYGWDDGLICGGRMTVLAQPLPANSPHRRAVLDYSRQVLERADRGDGFTEAVVANETAGLPVGDRYLFDSAGNAVATLAERPAFDAAAAGLLPMAARPHPTLKNGIAYLTTLPRITLLLVGGGHVGQAVAKLASEIDFAIQVLDDRERYVTAERFPAARERWVGDIGSRLRELAPSLTASTFALILTRGHNHDEEALYHLANTACGYVGMIGSRRKIRLIFEDLIAKGIPPEALAKVHAPLGYNIGSQTVPEIAISIVAELIACRNRGSTAAARQSWNRAER